MVIATLLGLFTEDYISIFNTENMHQTNGATSTNNGKFTIDKTRNVVVSVGTTYVPVIIDTDFPAIASSFTYIGPNFPGGGAPPETENGTVSITDSGDVEDPWIAVKFKGNTSVDPRIVFNIVFPSGLNDGDGNPAFADFTLEG